jgi:hypothetical protein
MALFAEVMTQKSSSDFVVNPAEKDFLTPLSRNATGRKNGG